MRQGSRGFTLIELMISVAIVSLLASIAIPEFTTMRLRSTRAEVYVVLDGMALSQLTAYEVDEAYVACATSPTTPLNRNLHTFDPTRAGWADLAYVPDGKVRCHYSAQVIVAGGLSWVRNKGICDLDNDNRSAYWWKDVDAERVSASSQHMVLRPSPATVANNRW